MSDRSHRLDWVLLLPASASPPFAEVLMLGGDDELGQSLVDRGLAASWRRPRDAADRCEFVVAWNDCRLDIGRIAPRNLGEVQQQRLITGPPPGMAAG